MAIRRDNRRMRAETCFEFGKIGWRWEEIIVEEYQNIEILRCVENRIALRGQTAWSPYDINWEGQLRCLGRVKIRCGRRTNVKYVGQAGLASQLNQSFSQDRTTVGCCNSHRYPQS